MDNNFAAYLAVTIFVMLLWLAVYRSVVDLIRFKCESILWKLRDDFVDEHLIRGELEGEDREWVWKGIHEVDDWTRGTPITSYILYKIGKHPAWNFTKEHLRRHSSASRATVL